MNMGVMVQQKLHGTDGSQFSNLRFIEQCQVASEVGGLRLKEKGLESYEVLLCWESLI